MDQLAGELGVEALDHTAIAVRDITSALPLYRDLLGGVPNGFERLSQKSFMWLTLRYPNGSQIELLQPIDDGGFVKSFLDRYGEGVHHMTSGAPSNEPEPPGYASSTRTTATRAGRRRSSHPAARSAPSSSWHRPA